MCYALTCETLGWPDLTSTRRQTAMLLAVQTGRS